jgi:hypothetical protein
MFGSLFALIPSLGSGRLAPRHADTRFTHAFVHEYTRMDTNSFLSFVRIRVYSWIVR